MDDLNLSISRRQQGLLAEQQACDFLIQKGLKLVTCNYRTPRGEIDLIMQDSHHLVFVEVRHRDHASFGGPLASITPQKQQKIMYTALTYLQKGKILYKVKSRFDVVGITHDKIEWIQDAFSFTYF